MYNFDNEVLFRRSVSSGYQGGRMPSIGVVLSGGRNSDTLGLGPGTSRQVTSAGGWSFQFLFLIYGTCVFTKNGQGAHRMQISIEWDRLNGSEAFFE